jgi:hypothetical protein
MKSAFIEAIAYSVYLNKNQLLSWPGFLIVLDCLKLNVGTACEYSTSFDKEKRVKCLSDAIVDIDTVICYLLAYEKSTNNNKSGSQEKLAKIVGQFQYIDQQLHEFRVITDEQYAKGKSNGQKTQKQK